VVQGGFAPSTLPGLLSRPGGVIIEIASVLAAHVLPVSAIYSGTGAYLIGFVCSKHKRGTEGSDTSARLGVQPRGRRDQDRTLQAPSNGDRWR
jgi:hypothetical protein